MNFFDNWQSLAHTAWSGLLAYTLLVVLLRTSGKRTLSKLNAFDLVVTVALGSTLASVMTSDRLPQDPPASSAFRDVQGLGRVQHG